MEGVDANEIKSPFASPTFGKDGSFHVDKPVGSMSISPCGRDVVLASRQGLHIVDLDSPWAPPRHLPHLTPWEVADVQWSPFSSRDYWVVSTSNQKALVWNLAMASPQASIEHVLHAHSRAITDINFSAHHPDVLATCAVDSFVHCWDLRHPARPAISFCDWFAGATQVKWNRQDPHIIASSHDKTLHIWDDRKGAYALRSIEAHTTKIYGVDWNRTGTHDLVTCSLDKTIKFWDYSDEKHDPKRVIRTPFPVWRARHTPFGSGLLAMPQRGDNNVYLYDRRLKDGDSNDCSVPAVKQFEGHEDQVKEFLWRPRGSIENNTDNREFQLVTWGSDRTLRLHRLEEHDLADVGYHKGEVIHSKLNLSRKNAQYKTFREDPGKPLGSNMKGSATGNQPFLNTSSGLDMHRAGVGTMIPSPSTADSGWMGGGFVNSRPGMRSKNGTRTDVDPISWMKGVKIGKKEVPLVQSSLSISVASPNFRSDRSLEDFESLGDEITHVGSKFSKVDFTHVDVHNRFVKISLHGPWGPTGSTTYVDCRLDFPRDYPKESAPILSVETTASLDRNAVSSLRADIKSIGDAFQACQRGSLEALIRYLQGEQNLNEILAWTRDDPETSLFDFGGPDEGSSSDDEDDLEAYAGGQNGDFSLSNSGVLSASNTNANVPFSKTCGATWSVDGRLVCFFLPKQEKEQSLVGSLGLDGPVLLLRGSRRRVFEGFGRFHRHPYAKSKTSSLGTADPDMSDSGSDSESSGDSSDSSVSSRDVNSNHQYLGPQHAFHTDVYHIPKIEKIADEAQRSAISGSIGRRGQERLKSVIAIRDCAALLPSKKMLAAQYSITSSDACRHNAAVALAHGLHDLADVWLLIDVVLKKGAPIQPILLAGSGEFLRIPRPHTEISRDHDVKIDQPVTSKLTGFVKWGQHPFGRFGLVKHLLHYFARMGDVQMLAMISCIVSGPYPTIPKTSTNTTRTASGSNARVYGTVISYPLSFPASGIKYFPSSEVAYSVLQAENPTPNNNSEIRRPKVESASMGSSFSVSTSDPLASFSAGLTPPLSFKSGRKSFDRSDPNSQPLSSSPERVRWSQRSTSNLATTFASSLPRPFSFSASASSSPPGLYPKKKTSPLGSFGGPHVQSTPWPAGGFFSRSMSTTDDLKSKPLTGTDRREGKPHGNDAQEIRPKMRVHLRNQDQFYNDGHAEEPFLNKAEELGAIFYRELYADLLWNWGMQCEHAEVLKLNGMMASTQGERVEQLGKRKEALMIGKKPQTNSATSPDGAHSYMNRVCTECRKPQTLRSASSGSRCVFCHAKVAPAVCRLCNELIRDVGSQCLACGHDMHTDCRYRLYFGSEFADKGCISGCNCFCRQHVLVAMEWPSEQVPHPASSAPSTIREFDERDEDNLGESPNGWEDVAYESLAKNLGGKYAKPKGASKALKPRDRSGSSSWH